MATAQAWVASTAQRPEVGPAGFGDPWSLAGEIPLRVETDLWKAVRAPFGPRVGFYLHAEPGSPGLAIIEAADEVWLGIDRLGNGLELVVSSHPVQVRATVERRPPDGHPGLLVQPVMVGMSARREHPAPFFTAP